MSEESLEVLGYAYFHDDCEMTPRDDGLGMGVGPTKDGALCWACGSTIADPEWEPSVEAVAGPEPLVRLSEYHQEVKRQRYRARIGALGEALQLIQDCDGDMEAAVRNIENLRDGLEERLGEFTQLSEAE